MSEYDIVDELDREIDDEEALYDAIERFEEEEMTNNEAAVLLVQLFADYERVTCARDVNYAEAVAMAVAALSKEGVKNNV